MQERHKSIANALELRLSCSNPLIWYLNVYIFHVKHLLKETIMKES